MPMMMLSIATFNLFVWSIPGPGHPVLDAACLASAAWCFGVAIIQAIKEARS